MARPMALVVVSISFFLMVPIMSLSVEGDNSPPTVRLISPADKAVIHDPTPTFVWEAEDPDGDSMTFDLVVRVDDDLLLVGGPTVKGITATNYTLSKPLSNGYRRYIWYVVAQDGHNDGRDSYWSHRTFTIDSNFPPVIYPFPDQNIAIGDELRFGVEAWDIDPEDQNNITYGLENAPAGATLGPLNHTIRWRPAIGQEGNHSFNVTISDVYITVRESINITVSPEGKGPVKSVDGTRKETWVPSSVILILFIAGMGLLFKGKKRDRKC